MYSCFAVFSYPYIHRLFHINTQKAFSLLKKKNYFMFLEQF